MLRPAAYLVVLKFSQFGTNLTTGILKFSSYVAAGTSTKEQTLSVVGFDSTDWCSGNSLDLLHGGTQNPQLFIFGKFL